MLTKLYHYSFTDTFGFIRLYIYTDYYVFFKVGIEFRSCVLTSDMECRGKDREVYPLKITSNEKLTDLRTQRSYLHFY